MKRWREGCMPNISAHNDNKIIYLDNAATTWPKPESVYRAVDDFVRTKAGNPGRGSHSMAVAPSEVVAETRMLVARLINAPETNRVIFTFNCTDALNMGLKGLLKPGDHVISDCIGHNSVTRPLAKLGQQGITVTRVGQSAETGYLALKDIENAINKHTRLIVVNHASNVNGLVQPIAQYGRLARERNLLFMVDAAQSAGIYPCDVQESNIDLLAFSGHKGLYGLQGTGCLYIGGRVTLDSFREGGTGSYSEQQEQPEIFPDKYESGTLNGVGICGLGAGIKFILDETLLEIQKHEQKLTDRLIAGLSQIHGIKVYAAGDKAHQSPVISCTLAGCEPGDIGAVLDQTFNIKVRTGLHCAPLAHKTLGTLPLGTIRLSPGYFNTEDEMDKTVAAFDKIVASVKASAL
jgi:cysteine desulfurase / selenocysteine lyase